MKLTVEQIAIISNYIDYCGIKEIDIKLELVDHIATQTEKLIVMDEVSFEQALRKVMVNWYPLFAKEKSFHIGLFYTFPKIVMKKLEARVKKTYIFMAVSILLWTLLTFVLKLEISINEITNSVVNSVSMAIGFAIVLILIRVNYKTKATTYRFLVNQSSPGLLFLLFIYALNNEMSSLKIYFLALVFVQFVFMCINYKNHIKCINKYRLA
jgi:hypothetical protein